MGVVVRRQRLDPRRAKIHRSYTVAEAATLFAVHRNTVRNWIKRGLQTIQVGRTVLILGAELRAFLDRQRESRRVRCPPGSMFCVKCRAARVPPEGLVDAVRVAPTAINLRGLCPVCGSLMYRRASLARIELSGFGRLLVHASAAAPSR